MDQTPSSSPPSRPPGNEELEELRAEVRNLREQVLDYEDALERLQSQHDVLENFCFGLEQQHEKAHKLVEATRAELQTSYDKLRTLTAHQEEILAHVQQGIFTVDENGIIGPEYSRATALILARKELAGISITELFEGEPALQEKLRRFLSLCFANPFASQAMLERLNPIQRHEYSVGDVRGRLTKLLSFSFARICPAPGERATKLLVVVGDETLELLLNRELERQAEAQQTVLRTYQILALPADVFRDFINEATEAIELLENEMDGIEDARTLSSESIERVMRTTHTLKGDARAFNLDGLSRKAHRLEELFSRPERVGRAQFNEAVAEIRSEIDNDGALFDKLIGMQHAIREAATTRAERLKQTITNLARVEAKTVSKRVNVVWSEPMPGVLPTHVWSLIRRSLTQFVRNSIAHGIELPDERKQAGKPEDGQIAIDLRHAAQNVSLTYRDDGRGIDTRRLRERATEVGLLAKGAAPSESELLDLVFGVGVSTAREVTELAGRGIGLDIVRANLTRIGGVVRVTTRENEYTEFVMNIPVTPTIPPPSTAISAEGRHEHTDR